MQYNNGINSIVADIDYWAGTDSVTYPIADKTRNANMALDTVVEKILRSSGRWQFDDTNYTDLPLATTDLIAGQGNYSLGVSQVKIDRVRIKDNEGHWRTLIPTDRKNLTDKQLDATGVPKWYDKMGVSIFLFPCPNYSYDEGIELNFERGADYFTVDDTTKEPGFASTFHRLISLQAALDYTEPNDLESRSKKIRARIQAKEQELLDFYSDRDRDEKPNMTTAGNREFIVDPDYGSRWGGHGQYE